MTYNKFKEEILNIEKGNNKNLNFFLKYKDDIVNYDIFNRIFLYSSVFEECFLKKNKEKGAFYTNLDIAYEMVKLTFKNDDILSQKKILDPAVGTGIFIFAFIKYLTYELHYEKDVIQNILTNVYTFDIDYLSSNFFLFLIKNILKYNYNNNKIKNFFLDNNKYDYIIGNPPYGLSLNKEKKEILKIFNIKSNELSNNSYGLFYLKAYSLLKDNGKICFITPNSFLNIKQYYGLRKILINDIDTIILLNKDVFKNKFTKLHPGIETVICLILKNNNNNYINIINNSKEKYLSNKDIKIKYLNIKKIDKNKIKNIYLLPISYYYTEDILNLLSNKKIKKVKDYFNSAMGIKTANNKKYISKKRSGKYKDIFIKGTSKDKQEFVYKTYEYIDIENLKKERPKNSNIPNDYFLDINKEKIGIPEIGHKGIISAFIYKNAYVSNSIWIYIPKNDYYNKDFLKKSLDIFNSKLYKSFSKIYSNNIRLEKHVVDNLPFYI